MTPRNVPLTVADQWRAGRVPHPGTTHPQTPNLNRLCRAAALSPNERRNWFNTPFG